MKVPNIFNSVATQIQHIDKRWLEVKDKSIVFQKEYGTSPQQVDQYINKIITYRPDVIDDWSWPQDTLRSGHGDCEDFALLKRAILLHTFSEDQIYFALVRDLVSKQDHAILVFDTGTEFLILDNFNSLTLPDTQVKDYDPIMTFSGNKCWVHMLKRG
jgi:predicted transglutaminase-like cysteine proteinase